MDIREALYTTRAMRRVKPDLVPLEVQQRIMDAAIRAPSGGNAQGWRFIWVDDPGLKAKLGPIYRDCLARLWAGLYRERVELAEKNPDAPASVAFRKVRSSAQWLADHFEIYPLILLAYGQGDPTGASIYPAVWSAQLAARAEGVGSALTSVFLFRIAEVNELLGVPKGWTFHACVTFGYPTGKWGVAPRVPVHKVMHRNRWDAPIGFTLEKPLWP
ncbi:MAG: nitroreductase family protein [Gammaproteobacteria bacterium]|nr:nitroreductase family protein [Gammaproteobacteria bacterium]